MEKQDWKPQARYARKKHPTAVGRTKKVGNVSGKEGQSFAGAGKRRERVVLEGRGRGECRRKKMMKKKIMMMMTTTIMMMTQAEEAEGRRTYP